MRLLDKIVMSLAVAVFVLVIICPDIPPPKGMKDQSDSLPSIHFRPTHAILLPVTTAANVVGSLGRTLPGDAIVALTCARLC